MKGNKTFIVVAILVMVIFLGACTGAGQGDPEAVVKAQEKLAGDLGIDSSLVEIVSYEQTVWTDSCLGLGGPAESCLLAEVPGYQVELSADGQSFIARTDETGEQIRFE